RVSAGGRGREPWRERAGRRSCWARPPGRAEPAPPPHPGGLDRAPAVRPGRVLADRPELARGPPSGPRQPPRHDSNRGGRESGRFETPWLRPPEALGVTPRHTPPSIRRGSPGRDRLSPGRTRGGNRRAPAARPP